MSRKARLLAPASAIAAFDWSEGAARPLDVVAPPPVASPPTAPPRPMFAEPVPVAPAPPSAPPADEPISAEHQARLAALEREAFTKGYAQGERAGLEAGGKRAEAMLRRVAQTI